MMSWEQAVQYYIKNTDDPTEIENCYYDQPILKAAERFYQSKEWQATQCLLGAVKGRALEIGAGRGIASYALSKDGWQVTALEPDKSALVGCQCIKSLSESAQLDINIVSDWGESLPFKDNEFDLIYGRAILHHAKSLDHLCQEVYRVLKPSGQFLFVREHVITKVADKEIFLQLHPLHRYYGGENAYLLTEYLSSLIKAGLKPKKIINPLASEINLFPQTRQEIKQQLAAKIKLPVSAFIPDFVLSLIGKIDNRPGRLYSFYGIKNGN